LQPTPNPAPRIAPKEEFMKKLLVASLAALVLTLTLSAGAEAKCDVTCLGHRVKALATALTKAQKTIATQGQTINSLSQKISAQEQKTTSQGQSISSQGSAISAQGQAIEQANSILGCLFDAPITEYGDPEGSEGFIYDTGTETFDTSALNLTFEGDPVTFWTVFDACNTAETASVQASSGALPPVTNLPSLPQPEAPQP
jgi:hypothetical protein